VPSLFNLNPQSAIANQQSQSQSQSPIINHQSAISYPCLCLCFWFVQITRTTPRRRITLHLSQIRFTDALTFMNCLTGIVNCDL
jgi:hypothetical protein